MGHFAGAFNSAATASRLPLKGEGSDDGVVLISLRGTACVLPAEQVMAAAHDDRGLEVLELWPGQETDRGQRYLEVETALGPRALICSEVQLASRGKAFPNDHLLQGLLSQPSIVGLMEIDGELRWQLDFTRLGPRTD